MNKSRRKKLAAARQLVDQARAILEEVRDEEQEAFDNLPESIQASEKGQAMDETVSAIQDLADELENIDFDQFELGDTLP